MSCRFATITANASIAAYFRTFSLLQIVQGKSLPAIPKTTPPNKPEDGQTQQVLRPEGGGRRLPGLSEGERPLLNSALDICGAVQQVLSAAAERPDVSHDLLPGRKATATTKGTPTTRAVLQQPPLSIVYSLARALAKPRRVRQEFLLT